MNGITILLGVEGIKQAYNESLQQKQLDIICLSDNFQKVIGDYFDKEFAPNVYGKIKTREILPDTSGNRKSAASKDQRLNVAKFIRNIPSESDMLFWENRIILISFGVSPMVLIISESELVKSLKSQFEVLWKSLI